MGRRRIREQGPGRERDRRVLVAIMNNARDFSLAREEGWYRIPLARAPRQIAAEYIAFYHTKAFPEARHSIRYYAPIRRFGLARRDELLPEEADHARAGELYYRLEIGPLEPLPHPIPSSKLRRVTFISTTLERLLNATDVTDLWEGPPSAQLLWEALRDSGINAERAFEIREGRISYCADLAIFCRTGNLAIECEGEATSGMASAEISAMLRDRGWGVLSLGGTTLSNLDRCLADIKDRAALFGGPDDLELDDDELEY